MYHAAAPSPHHGPQPTGRLPPSSPSYAPGPSTHGHQQPYATSGSYYAPPPPPMQHPASSSTGGYPASSQHHHMPPSQRPPQPQHAPQHPTPAVPHHSLFLKIHSYTPASLGGLAPTAELVVACRLFPQPTAPQTSNVIRLCFGSYPVATRVARNPHPQPLPPAPAQGGPPVEQQPGQELLLRCEVPSWDELVDRGSVQPGEQAGRVYLFCEVLRPNQVHGQPEHVLQRVWYGEFDYHGATSWAPADDRSPYQQQQRRPPQSQQQAPYAPPHHVAPSKRAGSPLLSPRRQSPQFYHHRAQPLGPYGGEYDGQQPQPQQQQQGGPYLGGGHQDYGPYAGPSEYDRGFEVQVEGGYYHPDGGHSHSHPTPRHPHPSGQQPYPPAHHGHPGAAPPHLMTSVRGYPHGTPPSPSLLHTPTRAAYDAKRPDKAIPYGQHPSHAANGGLAWGPPPPPPSGAPSVILAPPPGGGELEPPYSPGPPKGPPAPIRTANLAAPPLPGQLVRNLQPKSPKGPPTKKPKPAGSGGSGGSSSGNASLDAAPTTTTAILPGGGIAVTTTMKAKLELHGNLEAMALGWSRPEFENRRRLVQFWRKQVGATIEVAYKPVDQAEWQKDTIVISCIWRLEKNECYVTSVDTIYLLEAIIGNRFTVEEKNRIRRNLEGLKPDTISKNKDDTKDFFEIIMGFPDPKPRHIEKDVKVFKWEKLAEALTKIISKYSVAYNGPPPPMPPSSAAPGPSNANPVSAPLRGPPVDAGSGQIGTIPLPMQSGGSGPPYHAPPPPSPAGPIAGPSSYPRDYSQPPSMASYPPPQDASPRAYAPRPPPSHGSGQQHAYEDPTSADYGLALDGASAQGAPELGPGDIKVGAGHAVPLSFEFSDYFSTGTPPPGPPPIGANGGGPAGPSQPTQQPTPSSLGPSSGGPSDYHSPHRPTPLPATTPSSATAVTGGNSVPSPLAPGSHSAGHAVDPSSLRRPASEPPTTMSGVDLQPSPYSTLSFDGGVATATPEPVHPVRPPSSLARHELAGISLDLVGDGFDFAAIDDDGRGGPSAGGGGDDDVDAVGREGGGGGDSAFGGLLDDLQDSHHSHHHM